LHTPTNIPLGGEGKAEPWAKGPKGSEAPVNTLCSVGENVPLEPKWG